LHVIDHSEIKPRLYACTNAFPTEKLTVSTEENLFHALGQLILDALDEFSHFLTAKRPPLPKLSYEIFPRFINKAQNGPISFLPSIPWIIPLAASFLISINRRYCRVRA
jgi:hypothetical protein